MLYYCPGLRDGIKNLYSRSKSRDTLKEEIVKSEDEVCTKLSVYLLLRDGHCFSGSGFSFNLIITIRHVSLSFLYFLLQSSIV